MAFRLAKKASNWFRHIRNDNGFEMEFDSYYFCLIAGLHSGKNPGLSNSDSSEIVQNFPQAYRANRHLILALFLNAELKNLGISLVERSALNKQLTELINPISTTGLSDEGMKALNRYAYGGFLVLQDHFPEPPRSLDGFLVGYYQFLNRATI
jgi:hypothetical protein